MGLFDGIKGRRELNKIKQGGKGLLSIAQVTNLIINLSDAKAKLSNEEFDQIYKLFNELQKCKTKIEMDKEEYYNTSVDIIKKFDKIAPYEKYGGGNELEYSFLMDEIHKKTDNNVDIREQMKDTLLPEEIEYANVVADSSKGIITRDDANEFIKVMHTYSLYGKEEAINEFENISQYLINNNGAIKSLSQISYLLGVMNANHIITQSEMEILSKEFQDKIMKLLANPNKWRIEENND